MSNKLDFSYASKAEHNFTQRLIIKLIENITGKRKLEKLYKDYSLKLNNPIDFWSDIITLLDITIIDKSINALDIPHKGSLIVIANHPFGIIDGLILCSLVSKKRSDFKIMTHETLKFLPELEKFILPVDFSDKKKANIKTNLKTALDAKNHLMSGGAIIIFPSGSVSIAKDSKSAAEDDESLKISTFSAVKGSKSGSSEFSSS